jgi:hypothetical protein
MGVLKQAHEATEQSIFLGKIYPKVCYAITSDVVLLTLGHKET